MDDYEAELSRPNSDTVKYRFAHLTSGTTVDMGIKPFKTLRPGVWIHSAVLSAHVNRVLGDMLSALLHMNGVSETPAAHVRDVSALEAIPSALLSETFRTWGYDSLQVPTPVDPLTRFETPALLRARCVFLVQNATEWVFPGGGEHWVVYLCSPNWARRALRVYVLDSMLNDDGTHHSQRDRVAQQFFRTLYANEAYAGMSRAAAKAARDAGVGTSDARPAPWEVSPVVALPCPQQRNGHDCGAFAMTNIEHLVRYGDVARLMDVDNPPYTQADMDGLRARWGRRILLRSVELE